MSLGWCCEVHCHTIQKHIYLLRKLWLAWPTLWATSVCIALINVYQPRINSSIKEFVLQWNHHSLSSERCQTSMQLMNEGLYNCLPGQTPWWKTSQDLQRSSCGLDEDLRKDPQQRSSKILKDPNFSCQDP